MNSDPHVRLELLQQSLQRLSARMPEAPATTILLSRVIVELGRQLSDLLEHQIRPHGLAEPEFRVLSALFSQPDGAAYPSELCERTGQSPANMSRISDVLVSLDLISRLLSARDRRRMVLRITAAGEDLVRRLLPLLFEPLKVMFQDFSEAEQIALVGQLKRVGLKSGTRTAESPPSQSPPSHSPPADPLDPVK
jgi:MarR family transcriptional repressor of emrRAB